MFVKRNVSKSMGKKIHATVKVVFSAASNNGRSVRKIKVGVSRIRAGQWARGTWLMHRREAGWHAPKNFKERER